MNSANELIEVSIDDILNWAYCPLRYWWEVNASLKDLAGAKPHISGEYLIQRAVRQSLKAFYQTKKRTDGNSKSSLGEIFGWLWKKWLDTWGLSHLGESLVDYADKRDAVEVMFKPKGNVRREDGQLYNRPSWTKKWKEMAVGRSLVELQRAIDANQHKAGLGVLTIPDEEDYHSPTGLADAYAISGAIINHLSKDLPDFSRVVDVNTPLYVDLLSVRLRVQADMVIDLGEVPRRVGRPKKDDTPEPSRRYLRYEMFLFNEDLPQPYDLSRNLRLIALRQARPPDMPRESVLVEDIWVRHLRSGTTQAIPAAEGEYVDVLEALARAFINGSRAGVIIPRIVCGSEACLDCDYRPLCFTDEGVMEAFNPPLAAQIQASQDTVKQLQEMIRKAGGKNPTALVDTLTSFATWMNRTPGLTSEGLLWLLDSIQMELE